MSRPVAPLGAVAVPASTGRSRGPGRRRARGLATTLLMAVLALVGAALSWAGTPPRAVETSSVHTTGPSADGGPPVEEAGEAPGEDVRSPGEAPPALATPAATVPDPTTRRLGRFEDLELWSPSVSPVVIGYHEAATVVALGIDPVGTLSEDRNTTRTSLPDDDVAGTDYLVLTSRGRAAAPTSAIDVVLHEGDPVLTPVTGRVVDVRSYLLYGAHQDLRVEVVPDARPDLRLVLIHLDEVAVGIGDHVVAGVTPLAGTARSFPFGSHIDRETDPDRHPHVHLELQRLDAPRPGDDEEAGDEEEGDATPEGDGGAVTARSAA